MTPGIFLTVYVCDLSTGVGEGLTCGCWSVGVAGLSNYTDIDTLEQWESMDVEEKVRRVQVSREKLYTSGAHYVCDTIRELPWICEDINRRLANGETPQGSTDQVRMENETMESTSNQTDTSTPRTCTCTTVCQHDSCGYL